MIDDRLADISVELASLYRQRNIDECPSPGLLASIKRLETLLENFQSAKVMWRAILKVHPHCLDVR